MASVNTACYFFCILIDSNKHADDSTVDAVCSSCASLSRENIDQCRNKLMSSVQNKLMSSLSAEVSLGNVSSLGEKNLV